VKVAVYLTDVESPEEGPLEVVPRSHLEHGGRDTPAEEEQPAGVPILGPAGTVAVFDARPLAPPGGTTWALGSDAPCSWRTATGG